MALWTPALLPLRFWFDPSDAATLTLDGANLVGIANKAPSGGTGAPRNATYRPSVSSLGGRAALLFANTGTKDIVLPAALPTGQVSSVAFVIGQSGVRATQALLGNATTTFLPIAQSGLTGNVETYRGLAAAPTVHKNGVLTTMPNRGVAYTIITSVDPALVLFGGLNPNAVFDRIGFAPSGFVFNGDMGEIVGVEGTLSTEDRQKLEGYLAHRWGFVSSLPTDHPYAAAPPSVGEPDPDPEPEPATFILGARTQAQFYLGATAYGRYQGTSLEWNRGSAPGSDNVALDLGPSALFDASVSSSITQASGTVSQWADQSGNDRHATPIAAPPATDMLDTWKMLRFPPASLQFDGSFINGIEHTIVFVHRLTAKGGDKYLIGGTNNDVNAHPHIGYRNDLNFLWNQWGNDTAFGVQDGLINIVRRWTLRSGPLGRQAFLDGQLVHTLANTTKLNNVSDMIIGAYDPTMQNPFIGGLGFLAIYPRALTDAEIAQLDGHLASHPSAGV